MHILIILAGCAVLRGIEYFQIKRSGKILIVGAMLVLFGLFALYSVSIFESFDQTLRRIPQGLWEGDPSNYFYFNKQLVNILKALIIGAVVWFIPIKWIKDQRIIIFIGVGAIILQLLVFTPLGIDLNGARGWLDIPGIGNMQPAEFFKLGFVIFFAGRLIRKRQLFEDRSLYIAMAVLLGLVGIVFILIPDLGSMLVISLVACIMAVYMGARFRYISAIIGAGLAFVLLIVSIFPQFGYITDRLTSFAATEQNSQELQDQGFQNEQALIAIGGGGIMGQGYGKGLQKFGLIPEAQSDFIFSAMSEEMGLIGNLYILLLYAALCRYTIQSIQVMKDPYSKVIGIGILSLIMVQVFVNVGVNTNIIPNTGLTLPFISYGGTALMVNIIEIILLYKLIERK